MAIEHQMVGPVRPEHHHPGVGGVEIEVVVAAPDGVAGAGDNLQRRRPEALVLWTHRRAVGQESPDAMDIVAVRRHPAIEKIGSAASRSVSLQRERRVEQAVGVGLRHAPHAVRQLARGVVVDVGDVGETAPLVAGAQPDVVAQVRHLALLQLVLEDEECRPCRQQGHNDGHQSDADQESPGKGGHQSELRRTYGPQALADLPFGLV